MAAKPYRHTVSRPKAGRTSIDSHWTGIHRHGSGWRARVSQGRGQPRIDQYFPAGTDPKVMQAWRRDVQAKTRLSRKQRASMGTFAGDVARYLKTVTALTTIKDRERELAAWVAVFGTKSRASITPADIRAVRDYWLTAKRGNRSGQRGNPRPLAPGTVNKRLRALSNLYAVLDGRGQPNPVRSVPEAREPDPEPRALSYEDIAALIAAMPDEGRAGKGQERPDFSATKIRVRCLAYCQITNKQLMQLQSADIDLERQRLRLPARGKGRGAAPIWTPLLPEAVDAFRDFVSRNLFGWFSRHSLLKSVKVAARNAGLPVSVRVYDLRHSFATMAYRATGSLEAVGKLLQHVSPSTTRRYAMSAEADIVNRYGATVGQHFGATGGGKKEKNLDISRQPEDAPTRIKRKPRQSKRPKV